MVVVGVAAVAVVEVAAAVVVAVVAVVVVLVMVERGGGHDRITWVGMRDFYPLNTKTKNTKLPVRELVPC